MCTRAVSLFLTVAALASATPGLANPIVFDFEDGTSQGWTLVGAYLHPTRGVFSEEEDIAVFGVDGAKMTLSIDLTDVASVAWELFAPALGPTEAVNLVTFLIVRPGASPPFDLLLPDPALGNPGLMVIDLVEFKGVHEIQISWAQVFAPPDGGFPAPTIFNSGFINAVTFETIPEPSVVLLFVLCTGTLMGTGRKRRARDGSPIQTSRIGSRYFLSSGG